MYGFSKSFDNIILFIYFFILGRKQAIFKNKINVKHNFCSVLKCIENKILFGFYNYSSNNTIQNSYIFLRDLIFFFFFK